MASSIITLEVTSDHAVPIEPLGGTATVTVASGGTLYYADNPQVSVAVSQGNITSGNSQVFSNQVWVISAALSTVQITVSSLPVATSPVNYLTLTDTSTVSAGHTFTFGPRVNTGLAYPVPCIQPVNGQTSTLPCALDICCGANAVASPANGLAWIDIVSNEAMSQPPTLNANTLRLAIQGTVATPTFGEISTRKYGTNTSVPLYLAAAYTGSGDPQIYLVPQDATNPNVLVGYDGSDVFVGPHTNTAASAVRGGFLYLSSCTAAPTGVPAQVSAVWSALRYDTLNHKIWVYDSVGAAWRGVALA